jgi:hypothetical protein
LICTLVPLLVERSPAQVEVQGSVAASM